VGARKLSPEKIQLVVGALKGGADLGIAAVVAGVSRRALEARITRDQKLRALFSDARSFADERIIKRLYDKALEGDYQSLAFWITNRRREEWKFRWEGTLGGSENMGPVLVQFCDVRGVGADGNPTGD
jgi:hypothetical protein